MEGVTILNIIPEEKHLMVLLIIGIICLIVDILVFLIDGADTAFIILSTFTITVLTLGWFISFPERYEVIIDDSVSFNEFQEYYEIIDQKGKIYIVEVRE